jgi:L-ascorbate metabolism protein UlaG (beta-lactamase superfamily)
MILHYFGHSCFSLQQNGITLLFDPFLRNNPQNTVDPDTIDCQYILPSHAHQDHLGDTVEIAARTGATVIATAEVARMCGEKGVNNHAMHIGGNHLFEFGYVRITPAFHGSGVPGGHACGFIVNFFGKRIYHTGDTGIFGDMALLGRLEPLDVALLPIGDNFTMGPDDAAEAAGMLNPKAVVPMHYNTWPIINQSPESFKKNVEERFTIPVHILAPGTSWEL